MRELAEGRMKRHGLAGWQFGFNANVRRAGVCKYPTQTRPGRIELSRHFIAHNSADEVLDTVLHEIAHAIVGPNHGHDAAWKAKCVEIGARPERCYGHHIVMPNGRWQAVCPGCSKVFDRHRRPKQMTGWHCKACGSEKGHLRWRCDDREEE
ncbi:SprT-like domain-containing protein [Limnoglobus roseus]|uniref:SprT-like domain-containing protein n=1 Tax=Limnoglobus roseus TaxID=2598579 RepID=UPI0015B3A9B2|nr:SprT-like domain-containing protein [Limnoglobus roseus]